MPVTEEAVYYINELTELVALKEPNYVRGSIPRPSRRVKPVPNVVVPKVDQRDRSRRFLLRSLHRLKSVW